MKVRPRLPPGSDLVTDIVEIKVVKFSFFFAPKRFIWVFAMYGKWLMSTMSLIYNRCLRCNGGGARSHHLCCKSIRLLLRCHYVLLMFTRFVLKDTETRPVCIDQKQTLYCSIHSVCRRDTLNTPTQWRDRHAGVGCSTDSLVHTLLTCRGWTHFCKSVRRQWRCKTHSQRRTNMIYHPRLAGIIRD